LVNARSSAWIKVRPYTAKAKADWYETLRGRTRDREAKNPKIVSESGAHRKNPASNEAGLALHHEL
jgi:hypothetical protein